MVVIDILDVAIKEPTAKSSLTRKRPNYQCSDKLTLIEDNAKALTVCGEVNSNLIQFRTGANGLTLEFKAHDFSPTRGLLFRYSCNHSHNNRIIESLNHLFSTLITNYKSILF